MVHRGILQKKYQISSLDADFRCKLKISAMVNYFIQIAWEHAEELEWGYSHLDNIGLGWVFSRFKLKLYDIPQWPGQIKLDTWAKGLDRLFYLRDAAFTNDEGQCCAAITSAWLIVDKQKRRPKLLYPEADILHKQEEKHAINERIETLKKSGHLRATRACKVCYSDIDLYQHLTAVRYLDLMFDTYDPHFIQMARFDQLTVNYLHEIHYNEEIIMRRYEENKTHFFELINKNNRVCFNAELKLH